MLGDAPQGTKNLGECQRPQIGHPDYDAQH
jgi:hypothetical protein